MKAPSLMKKSIPLLSLLVVVVSSPSVRADNHVFADAAEVQAEFAMPIYRNPSQAELTVVVPKSMATPPAATVKVASPEGKEVWSGSFELSPGVNACVLKKLDALATGRYMAKVKIGETAMKRMLRIERIPPMPLPDGPIRLRKIFFTPDDWLFESFRDLDIRYSEPTFTEAYRSSRPEVLRVKGSRINKLNDYRFGAIA